MIVTVSAQYGCGSLAIAGGVAERLGYTLIDQQLPVVVAKRLRVDREAVEAAEEGGRSLGERLLSGLELATPELASLSTEESFDEEVLRGIRVAVGEYAGRGRAVILGRGAGTILGRRTDVVRVFLHAPRDWRIAWVVDRMGVVAKEAQRELDRVDRARTDYLRDWFGSSLGDPAQNDIALDTAASGIEGAITIVAAAVAARA